MRFVVVSAMCAIALAGCGSDTGSVDADADGDGTITANEARDAMAAATQDLRPEPGKYTSTMTLVDAKIPNAPAEMAQMMGSAMNRTTEFCLTPEEAERGFKEAIAEGQSEACDITNFTIDDGDVNLAMSCAGDGMGSMDATMTGKVTPTSSDMTMNMKGDIPELGAIEMTMAFTQERLGDCDS